MPKIRQEALAWYSERMPTPEAREMYTRLVMKDSKPEHRADDLSLDATPTSSPRFANSPRFSSDLLSWFHSDSVGDINGDSACVPTTPRLQKEDVLRWFHSSPDEDASWVLNRLVETVSHLVFNAVSDKMDRIHQVVVNKRDSGYGKQKKNRRHHTGVSVPGHPIIQFTSPVYYAEEGVDETVKLDVMRIGREDGTSEVCYETADDSALDGRSYQARSGKLVFKPGETHANIEVPIIDNPLWDTTTQFKCRLKQEGLKGAVLGQYLYHTRVNIIDSNHFPSDDFVHLWTEEDVANCNKWQLLRGYLNMVSNIPSVWSGSFKYILIDVFHNLWYLLELFMSVYLLDYIVDTSVPTADLLIISDRRYSLIICSMIIVLGVALSHVLDYARVGLTIVSPARNFIQQALLRKFLNYTNSARERLAPGKVIMAMEMDIVDLVLHGYVNMLKIYQAVGRFVCMLCFKLLSPILFGGSLDWHASLLLLIVPLVLVTFLALREETNSKCLHNKNMCSSEFAKQISLTTANYRLVIDYALRNHCEYKFNDKQQQFTIAAKQVLQVHENNVQFCKWCRALLVAIWLLYGGLQVIHGSLSLGFFTTNLQLFKAFGDSMLELYSITVGMMNTFPALENITTLMNYPIDVQQRKNLRLKQKAQGESESDEIRKKLGQEGMNGVPIDMMPIVLNFSKPFKFEGKDRTLNFMGRVSLHQGQLVAVVGPQGCGKATLMRLIAGSVLPSEDHSESPVFVPTHLRVANVADEPLFFGGTLYENLTYGMDQSKPDASLARVRSICKELNLSTIITDYLDCEDQDSWQDIFSGAQCKLLSIARALAYNAELMCIHKPFSKMMDHEADLLIHTLHKHIDSRGILLYADSTKRRPRTVIWSATAEKAVHESHNILHLDVISGIRLLDPH